ncbi:resistance to lethality of mkk1p386 overexpression [Exophiala dermatitidis]|uniref:MADS-box transcription factor n=2 Tax=Exophiala dermatitidis TaxID=5970 RepID=H6BQM7_EXODN|nr:MADS-box transcription factor [Exophiala dermatitidis NIH/UT8656]KAJ4515794.1 resistance to lethality of mkk1p386 overexpression [Exophiala dermatitidis]EHY53844.1 MADS-box transcription factor [Exophiala dermatitidis NIH/UT8656]KAJ4529305.1 resistance to lethality of mkk1p386 overexpression [Exophiala dermatitidis]KAJ4544042.1 resistance to lethality of mkk1p386 overexpression [Exophiala dermatitidis]KAJ4549216.1 resistance to lethality of mkk1p386 overexpression [Exophiala dermatitidis]
MGRRKIEIRAIKDDRNRSVTFLKRKGGLFKKAYELSVLCSVDVAVIIFGHNKKLYEFSSGDINETIRRYQYYGQPHEHKGPADFKNKGGDDDDDEDEEEEHLTQGREESLPPQQHAVPHMQPHNSFAHIQPPMATASPPMPNGMFQPRHATPQPPHMISRPASQNMIRRSSSNLIPVQHPHPTPPPPQNGFAYVPNPSVYNPQAAPSVAPQPSPQPPFQQYPPQPHHHQHAQHQQQHHQQQQQHPHPTPPPPPPQSHQQMQQAHQQYLQEQRRSSQPPPVAQPGLQPPPQPQPRASPQPDAQSLRPPEQSSPPQPKHGQSKSRSIFTPIDEGGSVLAQHFFGAPDPPRTFPKKEVESPPDIKPPPRSVTVPSVPRPTSQPSRPQTAVPEFAPPPRTDTSGSRSGGRPKLNLQIPSEAEDNESAAGGSPSQSAGPSANPARANADHIVLPPPSPSASAVMSAGTSGPPNPFARPPPPTSNQNRDAYNDNRNNIETPISALPSRYMNNDLLPSPSNFFSEWYESGRNGGLNSAVLPSPLVFPTPQDSKGIGFGGRDGGGNEANGEKRKGSVDLSEKEGDAKKVKT